MLVTTALSEKLPPPLPTHCASPADCSCRCPPSLPLLRLVNITTSCFGSRPTSGQPSFALYDSPAHPLTLRAPSPIRPVQARAATIVIQGLFHPVHHQWCWLLRCNRRVGQHRQHHVERPTETRFDLPRAPFSFWSLCHYTHRKS